MDDPRLDKFLDELLNEHATPEEACSTGPDLLPEVRSRLRQIQRLQAELNLLFPVDDTDDPAVAHPWSPPATPQLPGYEIEAVLGRGGMGIVYCARHLRLNRPVALKMLIAGTYALREEAERFVREAETVAGLCHPNIVQLYDVGDVEERPYFTMELVEGGSLARTLSGAPLPAREAAALVAAVAGAVHAAHQSGIIHRDLKPANILLARDGTPKVSDFGLARRLEGETGLTLSGAPVGTPSYMAPEQARGEKNAIGPATDVYSLGAILYELLTGRPPFRGESSAATVQQVLTEEPVPPRRLNPQVPRDLETICLKCLEKEPPKRYATAAALAADLHRFERGEPIIARPLGRLERAARWVRRRPAQATVIVGSFLLALAVVGGGLWLSWTLAETVQAVQEDLREVARLERDSEWANASAVLARAQARLGRWPAVELRDRLVQTGHDLDLAARLDAIHLKRTAIVEGRVDNRGLAAQDYEAVILNAGIANQNEAPEIVAERVKASSVRIAILAALDDWALCSSDTDTWAWLMEIARRADPDGWRDQVRDPAAWGDREALAELVRTAPLTKQPVKLLVVLADRMQAAGGDAKEFLTRVQQAYPADFNANFALANALRESKPDVAIGYYRAAVVARPAAAAAHYNLGAALKSAGQQPEAIVCFQRSLSLDPDSAWANALLAASLQDTGKADEAIDYYYQALRLDPKLSWTHFGLGTTLRSQGRLDEAIASLRQALRLDPNLPWAHYALGEALEEQGRSEEAINSFQQALQLNAGIAWAHYRLGLLLKQKGKLEEAETHFQQAAQLMPNDIDLMNGIHSASKASETK